MRTGSWQRWPRRRGGASRLPLWSLTAACALLLAACGGAEAVAPPDPPDDPPAPPAGPTSAVWPLAGSTGADADSVHAPFGPRALPTAYDFHAGVDLPAPTGTEVHVVLPGVVVQVRSWDGSSTGAGNAVLVAHAGGVHTAYLHLDAVSVREGDSLSARGRVGTVGRTGATYPHLHLGVLRGLPGSQTDERYAVNPLEVLPFTAPSGIQAAFADSSVVVRLPLRRMTVRTVVLTGGGREARVDYHQVLLRGSTARDEHVQSGVYLDAGRPSAGRFDLTARPVEPRFDPDRVVLLDFRGDTVFQARR